MITDEQSKAGAEIAKTGGQIAEIANKAGQFVAKIVGPAMTEVGGLLEDRVRYYRYKNLLAISDKVKAIHDKRQLHGKSTPIPARIAIPLLESAALEDDDCLQDVWARLIANSTDPDFKIGPHPGYSEAVKQLSPDEAIILGSFVKLPSFPTLFSANIAKTLEGGWMSGIGVRMQGPTPLYQVISQQYANHCKALSLKAPDDATVYLDNLFRLRIVELGHNFTRGRSATGRMAFGTHGRDDEKSGRPSTVIPARDEFLRMTDFGQHFVTACIKND